MGAKITVDSATLANKALEVMETHTLYRLPYDRIGVVIHPQSIVHSFVEFVDGSVVAQLGFPTMELPILYALTHPHRVSDRELQSFDPVRSSPLTFEEPDSARFPLLGMGIEAGRRGGTAPAIFNAANEVAVAAFLAEAISFPAIAEVVGEVLSSGTVHPVEDLGTVLDADLEARVVALAQVQRHSATTGSGTKR
jgi:1-deoxy-D-xylulose-5-phosphate reductoisomerase